MSDYGVVQTRRFARQYKKLQDNIAADVDQAVAGVAATLSEAIDRARQAIDSGAAQRTLAALAERTQALAA